MTGNYLISLVIMWPFVASLFLKTAGDNKKRLELIAFTSVLAELFLAGLAIILSRGSGGMQMLYVAYIEGFGLNFRLDGFRAAYLAMTIMMWCCSTAASLEYFTDNKNLYRYYSFSLWTFGATAGVFLSADLFTTFTFFELMSLASYAYVAHTEKKEALRAAQTYLAVAVVGGLVMLMGLLLLNHLTGTLDMLRLREACRTIMESGWAEDIRMLYTAGGCMLFGFGAKAGMFPLHIWLPKAHPVAPAPASALLSGVLTKCGVFGVLLLVIEIFHEDRSFGILIVVLGVVTMLTGAVLAIFSIDLKRTLACSSVSQIGFILIGAGLIPLLKEECTLAMSGTMLYMLNHSLFKLTLFLCAAAIYMKCHMLNLNDLKGYGRDMPVLKVLFLIGALGISGVPLFSGYVSKTLIHEGLVEYIAEAGELRPLFKTFEVLFLMSGGMTFAYMTKLFFVLFIDRPEEDCKYAGKDKSVSFLTYASIAAPAFFVMLFGLAPKTFFIRSARIMGRFNNAVYSDEQREILENLKLFSLENLKGSMISIGLGILFFVIFRILLTKGDRVRSPRYLNRWPAWLDLEELVYRPLLCRFFPFIFSHLYIDRILGGVWKCFMLAGEKTANVLANAFDSFLGFLRRNVFCEITAKPRPGLEKMKRRFIRGEGVFKILSGSISYGLMLICTGLCATLIYLLYLMMR